ncbi:MAG: TIGR03960 family B12-binding radical SAM protein [Clostridiales bacterium]|nr:TIGR03960 family B12-binding radical SAM protein [Clostridiales bacterium]
MRQIRSRYLTACTAYDTLLYWVNLPKCRSTERNINLDQTAFNRLLARVEKPARYIGGEWNSIIKDDAEVRFALLFPDVYEIGMSHLGSRILYHALNSVDGVACERAFAPWPDMEAALRGEGLPLFSLETKRPLGSFDVLGFSLLYEMCYTNILQMLDLAGVPLMAKDRAESDPLVICGGPCVCNPTPVAPFMDAVLIGDGEEMTLELVEAVRRAKQSGAGKQALLKELSGIRGIYVPSLKTDETIVVRRIVKDLDKAPFTGKPIVPYLNIVHDRVALEVMRGCTRGCRFCQAGYIYRPVRERKSETVMELARQQIGCTGYDEVSLLSLSTGDYSEVHELVPKIIREMEAGKVSVALPSLRVDSELANDLSVMQTVRKAGLTFAPEAGTQRLRDVINKNVTEEDILRATQDAFSAGWSSVKLYFMIGLPTETDEDILGIAQLARAVSRQFYELPKEKRGKGLRLNVSVSTFVPKPFTAFQWCGQVPAEEIKRKQELLRGALKGVRGAELNCHYSLLSVLEAAFSRGNEQLAPVLLRAYELGCRFDAWTEHFRPAAWSQAFADCGLSEETYARREFSPEEPLAWDFVDMLVTKAYLRQEYQRALCGETTPDCREHCNGCFGARYETDCRLS